MQPLYYPDEQGYKQRLGKLEAENAHFDYNYGDLGKEMDPNGPEDNLHNRLVKYVLNVTNTWCEGSGDYRDDLKRIQWSLKGYVDPDQKNPRNTSRDKDNVIVFPMTFRNRSMMKTAWYSTFIRSPMWRIKPGCGPASVINAATMEQIIERQVNQFDAGLHLLTAVDDVLSSGRATLGTEWTQKRGRRAEKTLITAVAVELAKAKGFGANARDINTLQREFKDAILYEGTQLRPWDPFRTIRDSNTTVNFFQEAEFVGRSFDTNINWLLNRENDDIARVNELTAKGRSAKPRFFNADYVKVLAESGMAETWWDSDRMESGRNDRTGYTNRPEMNDRKTTKVGCIYMEMQIIPKDWKCGPEKYPVKYFVELSADMIVTGFGALDYLDGNYSVVEFGPNTDGHEISPIGDLMVNFGMHKFSNRLGNYTEEDYRKSVNGGITLVNQDIVDMEHYLNQKTSHKLAMYAKSYVSPEEAKTAIMNFPHMSRSPEMMALVEKFMAWDSDALGTGNTMANIGPERPTVPGVREAQFQQHGRTELWNWIFAKQGMQDLFWRYVSNQRQFATLPIAARYDGMWADRIRRELGRNPLGTPWEVDPEYMTADIDPQLLTDEFEMTPFTGDMPQMTDSSGLHGIVQQALQIPEIAMDTFSKLPIHQMLLQALRIDNVPDIEMFEQAAPPQQVGGTTNVQVQPDQMVQQQIQAGNLVPVDGGY